MSTYLQDTTRRYAHDLLETLLHVHAKTVLCLETQQRLEQVMRIPS